MIESARLPPIYKLIPLGAADDPMARARDLAAGGEDPATILCIDSENFFDCAVILHPEMSLAESRLALYVGMLGLGDAIGSVVPAGIDITYRWPNTIDANVGIIAQVQLASPPGIAEATEPPWLVLRASVAADLTPPLLLESFSRHFLSWMNLWQNDGYSPVRAMWLSHSAEQGKKIEFSTGSHVSQGVFETIDEEGALVLDDEGATIRVPLNLIFSS